ncbi:sensor histidine kinase [Jeotgalibacillus marinus]|uniref:histidine kinase n=1 Tax=Jeotgalibacillus marinus TaxID=86667 RepID=A0ABV3Q4T0_9BACL
MKSDWKKSILKKGITFKIFFITTIALIFFAIFLYLFIITFLPNFYVNYKSKQIAEGMEEMFDLIQYSKSEAFHREVIDEYSEKYNVFIIHAPPKDYYTDINLGNAKNVYTTEDNFLEHTQLRLVESHGENGYENTDVYISRQAVEEATQALLVFFPYLGVLILVMSILTASLFSHKLSKPLLDMNKVAKKMANLDFSKKSEYQSQDEIGELSKSLNKLSNNLQNSLKELYIKNEKLQEDIEYIERVEKDRKDLFGAVSHELKTPVTIVKGQLEGMLHKVGSYKNREKYISESLQVMEGMEILLREILQLSKLDQVGFNPEVVEINLSQEVKRNLKSLDYFAKQKRLSVVTRIDDEIKVYTDKQLLNKALHNIIHNAMMYSPEQAQVEVEIKDESSHVKVTVFNLGITMESEHLNTIFERPFNRTENSINRHTGGSGLGLYIVKRIFDALSITYDLKNEQNGVLFTILIPKGNIDRTKCK